jgi:hypothetical protein
MIDAPLNPAVLTEPSAPPVLKLAKRKKNISVRELMNDPDAMREPTVIIPGMAHESTLVLLHADPKAGKSTICGFLAARTTAAAPIYGIKPKQKMRVLLFTLEEHVSSAVRRHIQMGGDPDLLDVCRFLNKGRKLEDMIERIAEESYDLVIIDSLSALRQGIVKVENDSDGWSDLLEPLLHMAHDGIGVNGKVSPSYPQGGPAIILIHHAKKSGGARGSGAIEAGVDTTCEMTLTSRGKADPIRNMLWSGRDAMEVYSIRYLPEEHNYRRLDQVDPLDDVYVQKPIREALLESIRDNTRLSKMAHIAGKGRKALASTEFEKLFQDGLIVPAGSGKAKFWVLAEHVKQKGLEGL